MSALLATWILADHLAGGGIDIVEGLVGGGFHQRAVDIELQLVHGVSPILIFKRLVMNSMAARRASAPFGPGRVERRAQPHAVDQAGEILGHMLHLGLAQERAQRMHQVAVQAPDDDGLDAGEARIGRHLRPEGQPRRYRLSPEQLRPQIAVDHRHQAVRRGLGRALAPDHRIAEVDRQLAHGGFQQLALVLEIMVHDAGGDAGRGGDARDAGLREADIVDRGDGRLDQLPTPDLFHPDLGQEPPRKSVSAAPLSLGPHSSMLMGTPASRAAGWRSV